MTNGYPIFEWAPGLTILDDDNMKTKFPIPWSKYPMMCMYI